MFASPRCLTQGVATTVPVDLQQRLWSLLDKKRCQGVKLDYLQIFELTIECAFGEVFQKVVHRQEVPPFAETYYYREIVESINAKVWIIDSDEYVTMLLASEY